jgi:hypothetical protein
MIVMVIAILVLTLLITGESSPRAQTSQGPTDQIPSAMYGPAYPITEEEYLVYSSMLNSSGSNPANGNGALLVIGTDTVKPTMNEVQRAAVCQRDSSTGKHNPYLLSLEIRPLVDDLFVKNGRTG